MRNFFLKKIVCLFVFLRRIKCYYWKSKKVRRRIVSCAEWRWIGISAIFIQIHPCNSTFVFFSYFQLQVNSISALFCCFINLHVPKLIVLRKMKGLEIDAVTNAFTIDGLDGWKYLEMVVGFFSSNK